MRSATRCLLLTATASLIATPRIADASCIPGFDYAVFAEDTIHIQGGSTVDSWNSSAGTYSATKACATNGDLGTNETGADEVQLDSASVNVCGDVFVGTGGTPSTVIDQHQNATVKGSKGAQTANIVLTPPTLPSPALPNAANMNPSSSNSAATLTPGFTYGNVSCQNGSLTLSAGQYVVTSLTLTANCELRLPAGKVEFYFTGFLNIHGGEVGNTTGIPGNLIFFGVSGASSATVKAGSDSYFALYAPTAACEVHGNGDIYGAIVCREADIQGNGNIHYDMALASVGGGGLSCPAGEISRASPVVALLDGDTPHVVQGTFEAPTGTPATITNLASIATWSFPFLKGHMRARVAGSIGTNATSYSAGTIYFDAGADGKIPDPDFTGCTTFNGTCRHIFTNTNSDSSTGTTFHPGTSILSDSTSAAIGALIAPASLIAGILPTHHQTIVRAVLGAKLGGVDRSTVAVIEPSTFAGSSTRPRMAYFGAADGMLHAVCAQSGGRTESSGGADVCPSPGTELWAFLPRVQLPLIRSNTARVDGSVRVMDVFGDFTNNPATGTKSWRTILTFQTGFAIGTKAAVYALDVTDPANPILLWEYTTPSTPGATELGTGLTIAAAAPYINGKLTNMVVAQTSNGGTGGPGVVATALSQETGAVIWEFSDVYPTVPRTVALDGPLPATAIPGGAVGVDSDGENYISDFVMGDIFGRIWQLSAFDGSSRNGSGTPLFSFSTNKHPFGSPPAIYKRGDALYAALASGGYADPVATTWTTGAQYLIAARLSYRGTTVDETTTPSATGPIGVNVALTNGDKAFSQALVVGTQLFLTADSSDINLATYGTSTSQTGRLMTVDLTGPASTATTAVITSGATSLASSGAQLYSSSRNSQEQLSAQATTTGEKVDLESAPMISRNLWLRSE